MSIPVAFAKLVDDAALFPPGSLAIEEAVPAHAAHLASDHAALVGPFIVTSDDLYLAAALADPGTYPDGLSVSVVVASPSALRQAVEACTDDRLALVGLEVKFGVGEPLARQVDAIAADIPPGVTAFIEMPRPGHAEWKDALSAARAHGLHLKFRTGGTEAAAFPSDYELATWIGEARAAGLAFKCTAGLHRAVRHTDATTGFEHHGYLNILWAATETARGVDAIASAVAERDPARVVAALREVGPVALTQARTRFLSYGSCSIDEPLADLTALHLLGHDDWVAR